MAEGNKATAKWSGNNGNAGNDSSSSAQAAEGTASAAAPPKILAVEVEALVFTKIMRHCRGAFPNAVTGLLIGLERNNVLEVTDCCELLSKTELTQQVLGEKTIGKSVEERVSQEETRYQGRAMEALRQVNCDCSNPGWYQTLTVKDMHDTDIIAGLLEYHDHSNNALVIGFDPSLANSGVGAFRSFRLAPDALAVLQARRQQENEGAAGGGAAAAAAAAAAVANVGLKDLVGKPLLEEVPLVVKNSLLAQAFLVDWLGINKQQVIRNEFEILGRDSQSWCMTQSIEFMQRCLDDLSTEEESLMRALKENARASQKHRENIERRRLENEQRRLKNEPPLPDLPPFQAQPLPSQLPIQFCANNARRAAKSIARVVADDVCRSYLLPQLGDRK